MKDYTYCTCASWVDENGTEMSYVTTLYTIGIYMVLRSGNNTSQLSFTPKKIISFENKLKKLLSEGKIKDLVFGDGIVVIEDERGFLKVKDINLDVEFVKSFTIDGLKFDLFSGDNVAEIKYKGVICFNVLSNLKNKGANLIKDFKQKYAENNFTPEMIEKWCNEKLLKN